MRNLSIAMFPVTSPIVINVTTRGLLAVETMHAIVHWLANLNIKRNITSVFVNKKHCYISIYLTYRIVSNTYLVGVYFYQPVKANYRCIALQIP